MKIVISAFFSALLVAGALAQTPSPTAPNDLLAATPAAVPAGTAPTSAPVVPTAPALTAVPVATPPPVPVSTPAATATYSVSSPTPSADDAIDAAIEKRIRRHFDFTINRHHFVDADDDDNAAWIAPMVSLIVLIVFGTPVLIVAVILYFSFSKNRAMHKTVRMMVEKGQPVPEALLNPPPVVRQRSDLRRGIKWLLVGVAVMIFFGACSEWDGGSWSIGIIPFMIGVGYVIFWRLDLRHEPVRVETIRESPVRPEPPSPPV